MAGGGERGGGSFISHPLTDVWSSRKGPRDITGQVRRSQNLGADIGSKLFKSPAGASKGFLLPLPLQYSHHQREKHN